MKYLSRLVFVQAMSARVKNIAETVRHMTGKVPVNGVEIFYEKVGFGPKVVLLLPGVFGSGATDFGPQLEGLSSDKFTLVAWDPRGFGRSIPPKRDFPVDYLNRDATDAAQLMQNLGFNRYSLVGWSDGGNTAAVLASMHPERIEKLVMWGCNSYVTQQDCDEWEKIRDISNWSKQLRGPLESHYGSDELQKLWDECLDATLKVLNERGGDLFAKDLKFITAPTLILHGMKDAIASHHHAEFIHENIKGSALEYWQDGKHNLHLRYPEKFNLRVESFLSE